jgi:hypothetical protein
MGRVAVIGVCAVGALACFGPAAASAAPVLELSTSEGALAPGARLGFLSGKIFETSEGSVECPTGLLVGTVTSNSGAKDTVSIAAEAPTGPNGVICRTTTQLGSVEVAAGGLPWTQQFVRSGKARLKAATKKLRFTITLPALFGLQCGYEASKIAETFPVAATGVSIPLQLAVSGQVLLRSAVSSTLCPAQVVATGSGVPVIAYGPGSTLLPVQVTRRAA